MKTMKLEINATSRKAIVTIDEEASVVCSMKKEGNGTYSVILKNKVDWPTKFYNVGKLQDEDWTIETTDEECASRARGANANASTSGATKVSSSHLAVTVENIAKRFAADYDVLATMTEVTQDELAIIKAISLRLTKNDEQRRAELSIKKLQDELAAQIAKLDEIRAAHNA